MADRAILREAGGSVIRIGGALILRLVARVARGTQAGELSAYVALRALQGRMRAGQREAGGAVVECGAGPIGSAVAH